MPRNLHLLYVLGDITLDAAKCHETERGNPALSRIRMDIKKSTVKIFVARTVGFVASFGGIVFFSRTLGAQQMGVFFLFQACLNVLSYAADFGLRGAVEKRVSEGNRMGRVISTGIVVKTIPIVLISALILVFRSEINEYTGQRVAKFLLIGIAVHEFFQFTIRVLNGELNVEKTAVILASRHFVWISIGSVFVLRGWGVRGMIIGYLLGYALMTALGALRVSTSIRPPTVEQARSLVRYAKYDAITGGGWRLYSWIDVLIIGFVLSQAAVGAYEIAWKVAGITMLFGEAIRTTIFPQISQWYENGHRKRVESLLSTVLTPSLFFVIPSFFGAIFLSEELLREVFGPDFAVASGVLIVFMGQKLFQAVDQVYGRTLQAIDRPDLAAYATVAGVVANLGLNIVLVLSFGIIGAAFATALSYGIMAVIRVRFLSHHIQIELPTREIAWCTVSSAGMAVVVLGVKSVVVIRGLLAVLELVALGGAVFVGLWLVHPVCRRDTVRVVANVL